MNAHPRKSSLPDLAILGFFAICAVLAALSSDRAFLALQQSLARGPSASNAPASGVNFVALTSRTIQDIEAILYALSPGLALVAYRTRTSIRRRRRGPGLVALAIAGGLVSFSMAFFCWFTYGPAKWTGNMSNRMAGTPPTLWTTLPDGFGLAITYGIVSAWTYMAVIRVWRGSLTPLERSGRCLGLTWIIASVVSWGIEVYLESGD